MNSRLRLILIIALCAVAAICVLFAVASSSVTPSPTEAPTEAPTGAPTNAPAETPTDAPTEAPTDAPTAAPTAVPTTTPVPHEGIDQTVTAYEGKPEIGDYAYMWYPNGYGNRNTLYVQTGHYALQMKLSLNGSGITRLGVITNPVSAAEAGRYNNDVPQSMPRSSDGWSMTYGGSTYKATSFSSVILNNSSAEQDIDTSYQLRLVNYGTYMQQGEIPYVSFSDCSVRGWMRFFATPESFALNLRFMDKKNAIEGLSSTYTLKLDSSYKLVSSENNRLVLRADDGTGFICTVMSTDSSATVSAKVGKDGELEFSASNLSAKKKKYTGFTVVLLPFTAEEENDFFSVKDSITVTANSVNTDGTEGKAATVFYDASRGLHTVDIPGMSMDVTDEVERHKLNRVLLTVSNPTSQAMDIPLAFDGSGSASRYIVGGCAMLLDAETGEPVGTNVQISKNWHDSVAGMWYQFYTVLHIPANTSQKLEFAIVSENWGEATAVQHSQLCLIGYYNGNWLWDESSLGASSESITYDLDRCLGRSMVDDVRGWMTSTSETAQWGWPGNVGGADFLVYYTKNSSSRMGLVGMKAHYAYYGPNLTKVIYSGCTADGAIDFSITLQLGRTNDVVRAYYTVEATFLKDTNYGRLALFQMAADGYSDNRFTKYAYSLDGTAVAKEGAISGAQTGYRNASDRNVAAQNGSWFFLYKSTNLPEEASNTLCIARSYHATINGTEYTTPYFNVYYNGQGGATLPSYELTLPDVSGAVKAGSTVKAVMEYTILPADTRYYYGTCEYLADKTTDQLNSSSLAMYMAQKNTQEVEVSVGTLVRQYPNVIAAVSGNEAAHFTLKGGLGYVAFTFTGLDSYSGWELQLKTGAGWKKVDQSSAACFPGNAAVADLTHNFTQCNYNAATGNYELTYNLPGTTATAEYRLVKTN